MMTPEKRVEWIRKGNMLFNQGEIEKAAQIFKATNYKDGLIRVGDYFYFEKHQPLRAYGYYRQAGHEKGVNKITAGFIFALKCWLWGEVPKKPNTPAKAESKEEKSKTPTVDLKPPFLGEDYMTPPPKKKS